MTKRYTTPYPAFRQVFAHDASEGVATSIRVEVMGVLVNGTAVLGKHLIRLKFSRDFTVRPSRCHDIIGRRGCPAIEFQSCLLRNFRVVFGVEVVVFAGEKPVEITLKSIPRLLTKRSKTGNFWSLRCAPHEQYFCERGDNGRLFLTIVQSFRSMNGPCAGVAQW